MEKKTVRFFKKNLIMLVDFLLDDIRRLFLKHFKRFQITRGFLKPPPQTNPECERGKHSTHCIRNYHHKGEVRQRHEI